MTREEYKQKRKEIIAKYERKRVEEAKREILSRECAWIDDVTLPVAGKQIRHMTYHDFLVLSVSENAFLTGKVVYPVDVFDFLWWLYPRKTKGHGFFARLHKYWFCRRMKISMVRAQDEIHAYLDETFQDVPARSGSGKRNVSLPVSYISSICHRIASEYGMDPDQVKHKPICRILQLNNEITLAEYRRAGKDYQVAAAAEAKDSVAMLRELNALAEEWEKHK